MSHLAEVYSLGTAAPLDRPAIADTFYPLAHPLDKVILIHAFAGGWAEQNGQKVPSFPAKCYDYFNEVVSILRPIVEPLGYRFYQIGAPGEPGLKGVDSLVGATTLHQCSHLVKHAALLIGNDSMWAHVAGAYGRPFVGLYGPTSRPHFPYWQDPIKTRLIESHRRGGKPSYASQEHPKTINWIPPEEVASAACSILDVTTLPTQKTVYIGEAYNHGVIELVPNVIINPQLPISGAIVIRMDYYHDEQKMAANVQLRKSILILNREVDLQLLAQLKPNILQMRIEVDKIAPAWLKAVRKLGIPIAFVSRETDAQRLSQLRLDLYDTLHPGGFDQLTVLTKQDFLKNAGVYLNKELDTTFKTDTLRFKTNRFVLSDNKVYLSHAHRLAGRPTPGTEQNSDSVIDDPIFWEDFAYGLFYHA